MKVLLNSFHFEWSPFRISSTDSKVNNKQWFAQEGTAQLVSFEWSSGFHPKTKVCLGMYLPGLPFFIIAFWKQTTSSNFNSVVHYFLK